MDEHQWAFMVSRQASVVRGRLRHLVRRKAVEISKAVTILTSLFVDTRSGAPRRGHILSILLVGESARADVEDKETGELNNHEIWVVVDHPAYRGLNVHWGDARAVIDSALRSWCRIELSVFSLDDLERGTRENRYIHERRSSAILLLDRSEIEAIRAAA